jgi:nucleoside-diphosphate-sugar epimerase
MVIGNWLIAREFSSYKNDEKVLVFASWVSNSRNIHLNEFEREIRLLHETLRHYSKKLFIYFSSCSIEDEASQSLSYVKHKVNAENIIKASWNEYLIIRTTNPIWFTDNPHTFLNYFYNKIISWEHFTIWKYAKRNLIDVNDLFRIAEEVINKNLFINETINIANVNYYDILYIVNRMEEHMWKRGNYEIKNLWWYPKIDIWKIEPIIFKLGINFGDGYLNKLMEKYYPLNSL